MSRKKKSQLSGIFTLPNGDQAFGNLKLRRRKTVLKVHPKVEVNPIATPVTINGILGDLQKVSCIDALVGACSSGYQKDGDRYHYAEIFPHFVTIGSRYCSPTDPAIIRVHFTTQDISILFHDFHAFGHHVISKAEAESLVQANKSQNNTEFGEFPHIVYFSGRNEIIAVNTPVGIFRVSHQPSFKVGSLTKGMIANDMRLSMEFEAPVAFEECIDRIMSIQRFLSVLAGRKQAIESISIDLVEEPGKENSSLDLHWMFAPKRAKQNENEPRTGDLPLDAVRRSEEFKTTLETWLNLEPTRRIARIRYAGCMGKSNGYSIDRLVAAANMFDIFPSESDQLATSLPGDLTQAQQECRVILKRLTPGPERDSVLGALGRMGKPSLTTKVLSRAAVVTEKLGTKLPDLALAAKISITIRNYFVHGNLNGFDYEKLEPSTPFLTDTLEFIFASSDLIDAGWNAEVWNSKQHGYGHSFARFLWSYQEEMNSLKEALS
ncbi:MAG: HEPN domain-containing protein [Pusillimonas sp.]